MGSLKAHLFIVINSDAFFNLFNESASLSMNYLADRDFVFSVNGSRVILKDANNDYINASYVDVSLRLSLHIFLFFIFLMQSTCLSPRET